MSDHILSQEEIDALLKGTAAAPEEPSGEQLEALADLFERAMARLVPLMPSLAGKPLAAAEVSVRAATWGELRRLLQAPLVARWDFHGAVQGVQVSLVDGPTRAALPAIVPAGDAVTFLNKLSLALATALEQELGVQLGCEINGFQEFNPAQPDVVPIRDEERCAAVELTLKGEAGALVWLEVLPADVAKQLVQRARRAAPQAAPEPAPLQPPPAAPGGPVHVAPAQFAPLRAPAAAAAPANINLILDVPLQVTVELGRRRMLIREVLELGKGSLIELDKLAGEPVDVFVNGKLIAKGEVVVIDENFGVKVTSIVSPAERLSNLQ
ncbi:MAG TPA: flagellar motor switch protein FliN [Limnochordales bacterium]